MPRSFDDVVAEVTAAEQGEPAPAPVTPGGARPAPATDIDGGVGAREPAAVDARMGTGPDAGADGGSGAPAPHPPAGHVVDPISGEVIDMGTMGADALASYVATCEAFISSATEWKRAGQDELRKRLGRDKVRVFGDWEVAAVSGRQRRWDVEDLRGAVGELIRDGVLTKQDVSDLIVAGTPTVNGTAAARLLGRVPEEHRGALEGCFSWERRGRDSVRVTRMASLAPGTA
jgi:hypothetical protein